MFGEVLSSPVFWVLASTVISLLAWLIRYLCRRHPFPLTFAGTVAYVCDGDTIWVSCKYGRIKLRLAGMDAPESEQIGGEASAESLRQLVNGRRVRVIALSRDAYGRWVSKVYLEDMDIGLEMIRRGHAWAYRRYFRLLTRRDAQLYTNAESRAKANRRGLWKAKVVETPWHWRQRHLPLTARFVRWIWRLLKRLLTRFFGLNRR